MKKIAFLASREWLAGTPDDLILKQALEAKGAQVQYADWADASVDWAQYDFALIRSTWDYYKRLPEFLTAIDKIAAQTTLINSPATVRWNANKDYLLELQNRNLPVVPTFGADDRELALRAAEMLLRKEKTIILKPSISANSYLTYKITSGDEIEAAVDAILQAGSSVMAQPYIRSIEDDGEVSLLYFRHGADYVFSHGVMKKAKPGEFRVQVNFGGQVEAFDPPTHLIDVGRKALAALPEPVTYARIDLVDCQVYAKISEIELIEPDFYLRVAKNLEVATQALWGPVK